MDPNSNIVVLLERLGRILQNDAHVAGLKPTQWEALRFLARANRFSRNPSALTSYLGITKGTVSQTLNALERKGLITKQVMPHDRRNITVNLTSAGTELLLSDPIVSVEKAVAAMREPERVALSDSLTALLERALQARGGATFGACESCAYFKRDAEGGTPHKCGLLDDVLSDADSQQHCIEHSLTAQK